MINLRKKGDAILTFECCYHCEDRTSTCHNTCDKYFVEKIRYELDKEQIKKQKDSDFNFRGFIFDISRIRRKLRGHRK